MYRLFLTIFQKQNRIVDEPMNALSSVFTACPPLLEQNISSFVAYFLAALKNYSDISVFKSALNCLGTFCDILGTNLYDFDSGKLTRPPSLY